MTQSDLECLKTHIDKVIEIETQAGERLLISVISVFDHESNPDVFFYDVTSNPHKQDLDRCAGWALQLDEIVSVKEYAMEGGRA